LEDLSIDDFKAESELFEADIIQALDIVSIADARTTEGGTGRQAIKAQLGLVEQALEADKASI
jgi:argininosuccinate lyase